MLQTNQKKRARNDFFFHMPSAAVQSCPEEFLLIEQFSKISCSAKISLQFPPYWDKIFLLKKGVCFS